MKAYYNELDPKAAAWLRELIKDGLITDGQVDERSIEDVLPRDLAGFDRCHFFAGIGVWDYALGLAGWPDDRQVWTGSCPCQPFSVAGTKGGIADERHLWPAFFHLIDICRPDTVFGEQVASKGGKSWFDLVSTDLEGIGYTVGAGDLPAAGFGGPHVRQRLFWVGDAELSRREGRLRGRTDPERQDQSRHAGRRRPVSDFWGSPDWLHFRDGKRRPVESGTFPLAHGIAGRVGLLRGYGNAIVAPVAQAFIEIYLETL